MKISANIDSVKLIDWHINTGEVNARVLDVEMSEELKQCSVAFVTFKTENEGTYESKVNDGVAEIPSFSESQWVEIGLYTSDMVNGELKKQYSPKPAKRFINKGSFCAGAEPPPKPTPGDYAELLKQIAGIKEDTTEALADLEKGTIKTLTEKVNLWELETGIYYLNGGFNYTKTLMCEGEHILIVYKIPHTESTVKYLHLCGSQSDGKSPIRWGYTDGTSNSNSYSILDSDDITDFIVKEMTYSYKLTTAQAVMDYVDKVIENLGVGENGQDGFSPIAKVEQTDNGANITITDKNGTTKVTVLNGLDGKDGENGKDGTNGTDGKDGVSATHSWDGTVLTVTSASGTTSANLKGEKGDKGEQGIQGIQGVKGDKGDTGATGSKGADGYTPVKGTDYYTEADKTEMVNDVKNVCVAKNQGSANVGKILVVGTDGNLILAHMPEGGASGDVIGTLDESNNILLSGNLADGTYTLKYENEDGTYTDVGTLEVGAIPDTPDEPTPTIINLATPNETATGETIWNSGEWCNASYMAGTSYAYRSGDANRVTTNTFAIEQGGIVYVKGIKYAEDSTCQIAIFDADGTLIKHASAYNMCMSQSFINNLTKISDDYWCFDNTLNGGVDNGARFMRIAGYLSGSVDDVIITQNQPIE